MYPSHPVSPVPALGSFGIAECHAAPSIDSPISPRGRPGCSDHRECSTRLDDICLHHTLRECLSCEMTNCSAGEQLSWRFALMSTQQLLACSIHNYVRCLANRRWFVEKNSLSWQVHGFYEVVTELTNISPNPVFSRLLTECFFHQESNRCLNILLSILLLVSCTTSTA